MKKSFLMVVVLALAAALLWVPAQAKGPQGGGGGTLDQAEIDGLLFIREEEKMARDVYLVMYEEYGLDIFANIAASEQSHMDSVLNLLVKYGIEDPATDEIGTFTDQYIQDLYDFLYDWGITSVEDSLLVGAYIEEYDILDIEHHLALTDNADIQTVYANLIDGSENHLRAFVSNWESYTGETYVPELLTQEHYDQIISSSSDSGGNGNGGSQGGHP